ncbi:MAG: hypothetical protein GY861_07195 [bacterium]|nr:hypothetical protein [bacterium]
MKPLIFLCVILLLLPAVYAQEGHMKLLAVSESGGTYKGSSADLYLDIEPGSGKVFLETFPFTKLDTQLATRFAKDAVCSKNDECDEYNFFYTISADSAIVAGSSAGTAVSILTYSVVNDIPIDINTAITGTVNSGGIIGHVGGLKYKIDAASEMGITKVLIPDGQRTVTDNNVTVDLVEYGKSYQIEVIEVSSIKEAIAEFTGEPIEDSGVELNIDEGYKTIMKHLAESICSKNEALSKKSFEKSALFDNRSAELEEQANELLTKGALAYQNGSYYSSASHCFGANINYRYLYLLSQNKTSNELSQEIYKLNMQIESFNKNLPTYETITDLQTVAIIKERLIEAQDNLNKSIRNLGVGNKNEAVHNLAYATERLYSATSWNEFFGKEGEKLMIDEALIREACVKKLSEAEERLEYVTFFFKRPLQDTRNQLDRAYADHASGDYELCLFKASKAKAEANMILDVLGVDETDLQRMVEKRLEIANDIIAEQINNGVFPIAGYSYYEYSDALKEADVYSSLLYSGYALELSDLDIYFKKKKDPGFKISIDFKVVFALLLGIWLGLMIGISLKTKKKRRRVFLRKKRL